MFHRPTVMQRKSGLNEITDTFFPAAKKRKLNEPPESIPKKRSLNQVDDLELPPTKKRRFEESDNKLVMKLRGALTYVLRTCVIGADNKIEDLHLTNKWVEFPEYRYSNIGKYQKICDFPLTGKDKIINKIFNYKEGKIDKKQRWYFHTNHYYHNDPVFYLAMTTSSNPLSELDLKTSNFFVATIYGLEKRQGNCGLRSYLAAKYLWEHHQGIERIEIASMATFDHTFVIVNRKMDSNLHGS